MRDQHESKTKLLDATLKVVRAKGYSATRIEDVCAEAGLTKGSFFHHFKSKEDLALTAVAHWDAHGSQIFAAAPYHNAGNPLSRLIAYIEFRKAILTGELPDFTCFAGTIIQEAYQTHPDVSAACERKRRSGSRKFRSPAAVCGAAVLHRAHAPMESHPFKKALTTAKERRPTCTKS